MNKVKLFMEDRRAKILAARERKVSVAKIAAQWGITDKRVYQILSEARAHVDAVQPIQENTVAE